MADYKKHSMARFIKKSKDEIGRAPDEPFYGGEKKIDEVLIRVIDFDANNLNELPLKDITEAISYQGKKNGYLVKYRWLTSSL